jgi:hypothetical protein
VDSQPPPVAPPTRKGGRSPYRLPDPLQPRAELPVAPSAPRIPRALRAFNGMPPAPAAPTPAVPTPPRPRDALTIRDLLEEPTEEVESAGRMAGLRSALGRLRRRREED